MATQLNIKDERTIALVRSIAERRGATLTATVRALAEQEQARREDEIADKIARIEVAAAASRRFGGILRPGILALMDVLEIGIAPMSFQQAELAHPAHRQFGVGTRREARLNSGDCFAYALAIETGEPLLSKGDDCIHTDVRRAL